ncbi:MAG: diacylglycerol kinase [Wenzhouxiangella sp.]
MSADNELRRIVRATGHSLRGIGRVWRDEPAFRTETVILVVLLPLAAWLAPGIMEFVLLIGVWLLVMGGELINSAIEAAIDRIGPEHHPLAGKAKDAGSALVMVLLVIAVLVWAGVAIDSGWS